MKALIAVLLLSVAAGGKADSWRTYAGGFTSRWSTAGHHGHDQPGCPGDCDAIDFARGNLDDSIGFRVGRERDLWNSGALHVLAGGDASVGHTEYNLSQRDFSLVSGSVFAGAEFNIFQLRLGARYGAGAFATTTREQSGVLRFTEVTATVPLRDGASVRLSRRMHAMSRDISVVIVADGLSRGRSLWEFSAATGTTFPGLGTGGDRRLNSAPMNRMTASRSVAWHDVQLEVSWSSTAHESSVPSMFLGYDGNFRSKTIEGYGAGVSRVRPLTELLSLRVGGGVEIADWRDEHRLLTRDNAELVAGVELGVTASAALRFQLQPRLAIEGSFQKVYWRGIDLGEGRCTAGIVVTR